jgi:hypothetical protein
MEDDVEPAAPQSSDVLHSNVPGLCCSDDLEHGEPKAASVTSKASSCARERDVLAGEASADDVDIGQVRATQRGDVRVQLATRPARLKNLAAVQIRFALPHHRTQTGELQA